MKYFIRDHIKPHYIAVIFHQVASLAHHDQSQSSTKRNVETFKYLNPRQPFPQRFLAGHSPTCWGLFPAPSIVPEIKMTAVFLREGMSSAKDLAMTLLRELFIGT